MSETPHAWVFDAYGTLFDVRSVQGNCETLFPGKGEVLTSLWRTKQLEYSWLRALMGRYENFWQITEAALRYSCQYLGLSAEVDQIETLLASYLTLSLFPDTLAALEALGAGNRPLAILSNGSPAMLNAVVNHTGLDRYLAHVISVDEVKSYKPDPAVYALAPSRLGLPKEAIGFVSSNGWDVAGAKAFGFQVYWLNRTGLPVEGLGVQPNAIITSPLDLTR